ncbi:MAG: hypothetical protein AB7O32_09715, partial [Vicinamibacterales bacterium]
QALLALRDRLWAGASARVPQVGAHRRATVAEAQNTLLQLLATSPLHQAMFAREHLGRDYIANLWRFVEMTLEPGWEQAVNLSSAALLHAAGVAWKPRLRDLIASERSAPVPSPPVGDDPAGYLQWLASPQRRWRDLHGRAETGADPAATPLLYRLLRQSALRELVSAAVRIQLRQGTLGDWEHLERELVNVGLAPTATPRIQLNRDIQVGERTLRLGDYIAGPESAGDPDVEIGEFRSAVAALAGVTPDRLDTTLRAALDSLSHRLDAWLTSLATRRLRTQRTTRPGGLVLGGYGWVEHLVPRTAEPVSDGFVHAPSLGQAVTAGILRSGYLSHTGGGRNPFAVNLSSERVRVARDILEGVRNGQTLPAVAGYRFERAIHEAGVDEYTDDFRTLAPMHATGIPLDGGVPQETVQPSPVVDGLALRTMWNKGAPNAELLELLDRVGPNGDPRRFAVTSALQALESALDATADALLVESVHQATSGHPSRAAATLDAVARGDGRVPQLEFVRTPRSGLALTHRVALVSPSEAAPAPGWSAPGPLRVRQAAAPALELIVATLLPAPQRVRATVRFETATRAGTTTVRLSECDLGALDCVYGTPATPEAGREVPAMVELAVADEARRRFHLGPDTPVAIDWTRDAGWTAGDLTFPSLARMARLVRGLLRHARPMRGADLRVPEAAASSADAEDPRLSERADRAASFLRSTATALADPGAAAIGLGCAARLGIPGAAEILLDGPIDPNRAAAIAAEVGRRVGALEAIEQAPADAQAPERHAKRLLAVFGRDFLPLQAIVSAGTSTIEADLAHGDALLGSDATGRRWLQRMARVRAGVGALERVRQAGVAIGAAVPPRLHVLQLPAIPGEPWVGDTARVKGQRLNVAILGPEPLRFRSDVAGVLVDEWVEVVPRETETTGVAFHYDTPAAVAPQSILLAVAPDPEATEWTDGLVERTLTDALRLARVRTVDLEALQEIGQLLPALYLPHNTAGDTASTDVLPG